MDVSLVHKHYRNMLQPAEDESSQFYETVFMCLYSHISIGRTRPASVLTTLRNFLLDFHKAALFVYLLAGELRFSQIKGYVFVFHHVLYLPTHSKKE